MTSPYFQSSMGHAKTMEEFFLDPMGRPKMDLRGSLAEYIILSKHYHDKEGMRDNDVHHEFTDFVIRLALEHKKMGRPDPLFVMELLPEFDDKWMGAVCFTDKDGKKQ